MPLQILYELTIKTQHGNITTAAVFPGHYFFPIYPFSSSFSSVT